MVNIRLAEAVPALQGLSLGCISCYKSCNHELSGFGRLKSSPAPQTPTTLPPRCGLSSQGSTLARCHPAAGHRSPLQPTYGAAPTLQALWQSKAQHPTRTCFSEERSSGGTWAAGAVAGSWVCGRWVMCGSSSSCDCVPPSGRPSWPSAP